ncbi:MAG: bifunctional enoyl-CoA hydratase/phosphate acetyltransferase [Spirochaetota bacterium]
MIKTLDDLLQKAKDKGKVKIAVASAADKPVLQSVSKAKKEGIADFILVGDKKEIERIASDDNIDINGMEILQADSPSQAAELSVKAVRNNEAQSLMKGNISTDGLLGQVVNKEYGLRKGKEVITHIAVFEIPAYHKLISLTDAAMNITPDLTIKVSMINSAVNVMRALGVDKPKVAVLGAVEKVNPAMQATLEAAELSKMCDRGQIKNCLIDGPLALDNAISKEAAEHKGIVSEVAGDADVLITPDINAGNVLYKSINFFAKARSAAIISGAVAPIVLTSRSDNEDTKLLSIALSTLI